MSLAGEETEAQFRARHPNSDAGGGVQEAPRLETENRGSLILPSSKPSQWPHTQTQAHLCPLCKYISRGKHRLREVLGKEKRDGAVMTGLADLSLIC